jgi:thioredoxin-like negative regulator of GroEL
MVKPIIKKLKKEGLNIEIIDIDKCPVEASQKEILSVPTFVLYDEGVEVGRASGAPSEKDVRGWLE